MHGALALGSNTRGKNLSMRGRLCFGMKTYKYWPWSGQLGDRIPYSPWSRLFSYPTESEFPPNHTTSQEASQVDSSVVEKKPETLSLAPGRIFVP